MSDINLDTKKIDQLLKAFDDPPSVNVGILGGGTRSDDPQGRKAGRSKFGAKSVTTSGEAPKTNAEIGAMHEFGEHGQHVRSFLRVPIAKNLQSLLEDETKLLDEEQLKEVIKSGDMTTWMKQVGIAAELAVSDAFDTGGDGAWFPSNMEHKKNKQTLVETAQLRRSITSQVKK